MSGLNFAMPYTTINLIVDCSHRNVPYEVRVVSDLSVLLVRKKNSIVHYSAAFENY